METLTRPSALTPFDRRSPDPRPKQNRIPKNLTGLCPGTSEHRGSCKEDHLSGTVGFLSDPSTVRNSGSSLGPKEAPQSKLAGSRKSDRHATCIHQHAGAFKEECKFRWTTHSQPMMGIDLALEDRSLGHEAPLPGILARGI